MKDVAIHIRDRPPCLASTDLSLRETELFVVHRPNEMIAYEFNVRKLRKGTTRIPFFFDERVQEVKHVGAEAVVLACTELPLPIDAASCEMPVIDTAQIHAVALFEQPTRLKVKAWEAETT